MRVVGQDQPDTVSDVVVALVGGKFSAGFFAGLAVRAVVFSTVFTATAIAIVFAPTRREGA